MWHVICSDKGNIKKINQDGALYKEARIGNGGIMLAAVCDGLGGLKDGEVASTMVVQALGEWFDNDLPEMAAEGITDAALIESLNRLIVGEDERVAAYGDAHGECGTTLSAVIACGGIYLCVNIGDSRVYLITNENISQLTHDQTKVQQMVDAGDLTPEQAETHPERNVLLQCIGAGGDVLPEYSAGEYRKGDTFIVCSDGFRHKLSKEEMVSLFGKNAGSEKKLAESAKRAVEVVMKRKERDNVTVVVVRV